MHSTSRTSKSIKNSLISLVYFSISFILSFYSRKIFLDYLGRDILGLNTTATNLLQFLNLAELGINTAVGFTLYKPIRENNYDSINEIISLQGYLYRRIGITIIIGAIILMCFFPKIFNKISLPLWYTYASFSVLLLSSLIGYFYNYKQVLLTASQLNYKITYSYNSVIIIKVCTQMTAVRLSSNPYIWWLIIEASFAFISAVVLQWMTRRTFPFLDKVSLSFKDLRKKYTDFTKKIKQLFFHKMVALIINQSSPLIIYGYSSLSLVALYGNYLIIIHGVTSLFNTIFNSIGAGIGNLVAEGDNDKTLKVFKELFSLRFFLLSVIAFCVYCMSQSFISLWIGPEYLLSNATLLLMDLIMLVTFTRYSVESFILAYGMVQDIFSPIIEAILNLGLSVTLGYFWGLNGILSGTLISLCIVGLGWKPYFLFSRKLPGKYKIFLKLFFRHIVISIIVCVACYLILNKFEILVSSNWLQLIIKGIVCFALITLSLFWSFSFFKCGTEMFLQRLKIFRKQ